MTYAQQVIKNSQEMSYKEGQKYLSNKMRELDENYQLAVELGTSTEGIDQAMKEIMNYVIGY